VVGKVYEVMFKEIFNKRKVFSPADFGESSEWFLCNGLTGALSWGKIGFPIEFNNGYAPSWYSASSDKRVLDKIWSLQEEYVTNILLWMDSKTIIKAYFDGAHEKGEKWFFEKYGIKSGSDFQWEKQMANDIVNINARNLVLEASDGTILIEYGTWDTIFIKPSAESLPDSIKLPSVKHELVL
jgi:hypothetical protein